MKRVQVYTGGTWVHDGGGKCCDLCLQPMSLIEIGTNKFPIWVHKNGGDCKGLRLTYNFTKTINRRMEDFKRHLRFEMVGDYIRRYRENED